MLISILGATGYVGMTFVNRTSQMAPDVSLKVAGRNHTKLAALQKHPNVRSTHVYEQGKSLESVLDGADACIDLSYQTSGTPSRQIMDSQLHALNLVRTCHEKKVKNLIIVGSVAVYGVPVIKYPWASAPHPRHLAFPTSVYSRVKAVVEESAAKSAGKYAVSMALIRSGHILGPGSKMASNIASALLRQDCLLLSGRSAPSNATTVQGLTSTLLSLAVTGWNKSLLIGNHIDLGQVAYDDIVRYFSTMLGIEAVTGSGAASKATLRSRFLQNVRKYEGELSVLQSYVGWSEGIVDRVRQMSRTEKATVGLAGTGNNAQCNGIVPLYLSDMVPHSQDVCGVPLELEHLSAELSDVARWLETTGFVGNSGRWEDS